MATVEKSKEGHGDIDDNNADSSMSLLCITDGENDRRIPVVKFIDDLDVFANSFSPPASVELMIGAYSELHSKFKTFETSLTQKSTSGDWIVIYVDVWAFVVSITSYISNQPFRLDSYRPSFL